MGAAQYIGYSAATDDIVSITVEEQVTALLIAEIKCNNSIDSIGENKEGHCKTTWDGIACWKATPAGTTAEMACPDYVNGFSTQGNASKKCTETGEWFYNHRTNGTWTNYSNCMKHPFGHDPPESYSILIPQEHSDRIKLMYSIGYGISLLALAIAIFIMVYFKRLHCPRNTIHLHLFVAFALRALLSFLKDNLLVNHIGLPNDVMKGADGAYTINPEGTHWQCKLLFSTFHYVALASKFWVFVEGLYLHVLVTITIFSERRFIRWTTLFGWGGPLLFLVPWMCIRAIDEDVLCWNIHPTYFYYLILKGPQVAIVVINFVFFLNIVRVLCTKLVRSAPPRARKYRYRRLGKSTLVLIPILGVHFLITVAVPENEDTVTLTIKLYFEMLFNSFQGLLIAFLFCFLNEEVQSELRKRYIRKKLRANFRQFPNKYVNVARTSSTPLDRSNSSPDCLTYSARRHSREARDANSSSHSGSAHLVNQEKKRNGSYNAQRPLRYYKSQPPHTVPTDAKHLVYVHQRRSYV